MPDQVTLVIYVYNEYLNLKQIMPTIKKEWYDQLIIIDGGSTDGSYEYLKQKGYEIYKQKQPHWAGAYMEAYEHAKGDIIVDFSPDGNSIAEKIPELVTKIKEGYDMVIASRYCDNAKSYDDTKITALGNYIFTNMINVLFSKKYTDALVIFRAYRMDFINECLLPGPLDNANTSLLCCRAARYNKRVADIPADEPKRIHGNPKMRIVVDGFRNLKVIIPEFIKMF